MASLATSLFLPSLSVVSLNVNGLRDHNKRRKVFLQLLGTGAQVFYLQETHTTPADEEPWRLEWEQQGGGQIFFSHGEFNSCGTAIMFLEDFKPEFPLPK